MATAQFTSVTWTGEDSVLETEDYASSTEAGRVNLSETFYDAMGRVFRTKAWTIDSSGDEVACLLTDLYYDRNSRLVASKSPGSGGQEYAYDGAGRRIETRVVKALKATKYVSGAFNYCAPEPGYITGGNEDVVQFSRVIYDGVGNVTGSLTFEANHEDTNGLDLSGSDFVRTTTFNWYEPTTHYLMTSAYYGSGAASWTNASALTPAAYESRPTASSSDALVTGYAYSKGRLDTVIDPNAIDTKYTYDDLGLTVKVEEDQGGANERTTLTQYDGLGNTVKQIADVDNDDTTFTGGAWTTDSDDQVTTYLHEDPYDASLATNIIYPDSSDTDSTGGDQVKFTYALDGQVVIRTAPVNGQDTANVITYEYDTTLRRQIKQRVTADGTGVDVTIRSIVYSYDSQGRREKVTSYSQANPTIGTDTPINEVKYHFTDFGAVSKEYQAHVGAVDDDGQNGDTPAVEYAYDTATDTINGVADVYTHSLRLTSVTYPNGRKSFRNYGTSGELDDKLSRVAAIKDDNGSGSEGYTLAAYSYNGVGRLVIEDFVKPSGATAPEIKLDYYGGTSGTYAGFDRFGRVKQQLWRDYGAGADRDKFTYEYDYNSNRKYRENVVATAASKKLDELYAYDNLNRVVAFKRGKLNQGKTDIPTTDSDRLRGEAWTLTPTGNWNAYRVDVNGSGGTADGDYGDTGDLDQTREHNKANEIEDQDQDSHGIETAYGTAWADPVHDARGNMTTLPRPGDMTAVYTCAYDAWNRLTKVVAGQTTVAEYRYDGLNRRIRKYTDKSGDNWTVREYYYNVSWQTLQIDKETEDRTGGVEPAVADALNEQYVWSLRYVDAPILQDRETDNNPETGALGKEDSGLDERLYYLTDAQMNVTALVTAAGTVVERCAYDPYGQPIFYDGSWGSQSSSSHGNAILYGGYYYDAETGFYHVRNRMYHAQLGRWLTRDPLGYADGMSLYEYVGSAPISYTDALGLAKVLTKSAGKKTKEVVHSAIVVNTEKGCPLVLSWEEGGWKIIDYKYYKEKMYPDRDIFETEVLDATGKSLDDKAILVDVAKSKETDWSLRKNCAIQTHRVLAKHGMDPVIPERVLPEQLHKDTFQKWGGETTQVGKQSAGK